VVVFVGKQGGEGVGEVESGSVIEFDRVPVVTPTGDVLLRSLSLKVEAGGNVLVTGPNGAGKSSIFRYAPHNFNLHFNFKHDFNHLSGAMSGTEVVPLSLGVCMVQDPVWAVAGAWWARGEAMPWPAVLHPPEALPPARKPQGPGNAQLRRHGIRVGGWAVVQ
jgi:hypothetical protein